MFRIRINFNVDPDVDSRPHWATFGSGSRGAPCEVSIKSGRYVVCHCRINQNDCGPVNFKIQQTLFTLNSNKVTLFSSIFMSSFSVYRCGFRRLQKNGKISLFRRTFFPTCSSFMVIPEEKTALGSTSLGSWFRDVKFLNKDSEGKVDGKIWKYQK